MSVFILLCSFVLELMYLFLMLLALHTETTDGVLSTLIHFIKYKLLLHAVIVRSSEERTVQQISYLF